MFCLLLSLFLKASFNLYLNYCMLYLIELNRLQTCPKYIGSTVFPFVLKYIDLELIELLLRKKRYLQSQYLTNNTRIYDKLQK